ncbi:MAG TPA: hypothetical protein DHM37_06085, partial [Candidatus Cloacimonas sp.]|nr:hypothetical protein [Candidatus Cloacimonas sp.]
MTRKKLKKIIGKMDENDYEKFRKDFGGDDTEDELIRNYIDHPEWEPRICHILGLKTEKEKMQQATIFTGYAAVISSSIALISLI